MPAREDEIARKLSEPAFRHGDRRMAVEDVARERHISKKTVDDDFTSKEDLLRYAVELAPGSSAPASSR